MKMHFLRDSFVFSSCLIFVLSACSPSQAEIQVTQQIAQTQTQAARPTATATQMPTMTQTPGPSPTPLYMDLATIQTFVERGLGISNVQFNEQLGVLAVRYEGRHSANPTALRITVRYQTPDYESHCLTPIIVVSWGILSNNPVTVFPASLKFFKIDCYSPTSDLLFAYQVTLADAVELVALNNLASVANSGKIYALRNNLPVVPNIRFARNATPAPQDPRTR